MSSETLPITPARFAEALKELPASSLALKVLELRNSIAHLDYSNAELKPFAEGTATAIGSTNTPSQPDQDCVDAIAENEAVIRSMQERISLLKTEVESRGLDWREFQGKADEEEEVVVNQNGTAETTPGGGNLTNGVNGATNGGEAQQQQQHEAWRDGTFQTGTIHGMTDEELLRQLTERMPLDDNEEQDADGGMHL